MRHTNLKSVSFWWRDPLTLWDKGSLNAFCLHVCFVRYFGHHHFWTINEFKLCFRRTQVIPIGAVILTKGSSISGHPDLKIVGVLWVLSLLWRESLLFDFPPSVDLGLWFFSHSSCESQESWIPIFQDWQLSKAPPGLPYQSVLFYGLVVSFNVLLSLCCF